MSDLTDLYAAIQVAGVACAACNVLQLYRDRCLRGIYWPLMAFYIAAGFVALAHFADVGNWLGFAGACALTACNIVWLLLAIAIRLDERLDRALEPISYGAKHDH